MLFQTPTSPQSRFSILIFDSGFGGLSVYNKIRFFLPNLHYIYSFDSIGFPYGEKSATFIIKRVAEIISVIQKQYSLALAVIACNTASTVALPALREKFSFPVVGTVPAIQLATHLTINGIIGLLATNGTVKCSYTRELVHRFASRYQVVMLASPELVEIAEEKVYGKKVSLEELHSILLPWLQMPELPDTVILGCTHFLLLQDELQSVFPKGTKLVDSVSGIKRKISWLLENAAPDAKSSDPNIVFFSASIEESSQLFSIFYRYGFQIIKKMET